MINDTKTGTEQMPERKSVLLPQHIEQCTKSGLTPETMLMADLRSISDPVEGRSMLNWSPQAASPPLPALAFAYPDLRTGGLSGYYRLRPDASRRRNPDYEAANEHADGHGRTSDEPEYIDGPKYLGPKDQPSRLYAPIRIRPEILDPQVRLWLTEGEKKALAGCQSGFAMVAAPGVYNFGDATTRREAKASGLDTRKLHPDFAHLQIEDREVVIIFDSDIDLNANVQRAAATLGTMLTEAGADAKISYINAKGQQKVGLDDYLAGLPEQERMRQDPLRAVESAVRPFNVEEVIDWLKEQWDDWTAQEQQREVRRAARLASALMPVGSDFGNWCARAGKSLKCKATEIKAHGLPRPEKKKSKLDPRSWLSAWLAAKKAKFSYRESSVTIGADMKPLDVILSTVALDAAAQENGPTENHLNHALTIWLHEQRKAVVDSYRARLAYKPDLGDQEIRRWVRAVTGDEDPIYVAALRHFIWQVKRKLHDLRVEHHLMLLLQGAQGSGKTRAILALLGPVMELTDPTSDLSVLADERQAFRFTQSFIVFCDEMGKAGRTDMDALKNRITAEILSWRLLGTNQRQTGFNRATMLGALNPDLSEVLYDPTGMRRFLQMEVLPRIDWDAIGQIDYGKLWASVDHLEPCPLLPVLEELRERQESLRAKDAVEEWLDNNCLVGEGWTAAETLYRKFGEAMKDQRRPLLSGTKWGRRMGDLIEKRVGGEGMGWKMSDGKKYAVTLKSRYSPDEQKMQEMLTQEMTLEMFKR